MHEGPRNIASDHLSFKIMTELWLGYVSVMSGGLSRRHNGFYQFFMWLSKPQCGSAHCDVFVHGVNLRSSVHNIGSAQPILWIK